MTRPTTISERIEAGCRALNLAQVQLAQMAGLPTRQLLTQIKSGDRPGRKYLPGIAASLHCSVEWLVNGTGVAPSWAEDSEPSDPPSHSRMNEPTHLYQARDAIEVRIAALEQQLAQARHANALLAEQLAAERAARIAAEAQVQAATAPAKRKPARR